MHSKISELILVSNERYENSTVKRDSIFFNWKTPFSPKYVGYNANFFQKKKYISTPD